MWRALVAGENKGAEEMEIMAELRRVVCAMREDVPVGERQIRLRTFHDVVRPTFHCPTQIIRRKILEEIKIEPHHRRVRKKFS